MCGRWARSPNMEIHALDTIPPGGDGASPSRTDFFTTSAATLTAHHHENANRHVLR